MSQSVSNLNIYVSWQEGIQNTGREAFDCFKHVTLQYLHTPSALDNNIFGLLDQCSQN